MTTIAEMIRYKSDAEPYRFFASPIVTNSARAMFPYPNFWRGDYKCDYPIIDARQAGFRPRIDVGPPIPVYDSFKLPKLCFETAPHTTFPCYDKPGGQHGMNCLYRYGSR